MTVKNCYTCANAPYRNGAGGPCVGCINYDKWQSPKVTASATADILQGNAEVLRQLPEQSDGSTCNKPKFWRIKVSDIDIGTPRYEGQLTPGGAWIRLSKSDFDSAEFVPEALTHTPEQSDGSTASYYTLPEGATELQDLISYRNMNAQMGEIFRAVYRYGQVAHSPRERDLRKIIFYAQAELDRLAKYAG